MNKSKLLYLMMLPFLIFSMYIANSEPFPASLYWMNGNTMIKHNLDNNSISNQTISDFYSAEANLSSIVYNVATKHFYYLTNNSSIKSCSPSVTGMVGICSMFGMPGSIKPPYRITSEEDKLLVSGTSSLGKNVIYSCALNQNGAIINCSTITLQGAIASLPNVLSFKLYNDNIYVTTSNAYFSCAMNGTNVLPCKQFYVSYQTPIIAGITPQNIYFYNKDANEMYKCNVSNAACLPVRSSLEPDVVSITMLLNLTENPVIYTASKMGQQTYIIACENGFNYTIQSDTNSTDSLFVVENVNLP